MAIIGIITDFGARGLHYVAEMKGVALQVNPKVTFIDIIHEITPYSIREAAYVLQTVVFTYPKGTIFVCVVDPGVGSERDILAVELFSGQIIIGPDNGIFSYFIAHNQIKIAIKITESEFYNPALFILKKPSNDEKISIFESESPVISEDFPEPLGEFEEPEMKNPFLEEDLFNTSTEVSPSSTFHGRDIMMPVAAHLTQGLDIFALGEPKENFIQLSDIDPEISEDKNTIIGLVQFIDSFSNIITNIPTEEFNLFLQSSNVHLEITIEDRTFKIIRSAFFEGNLPDQLLLIEGSSGFLELCYNKERAAENLNLKVDQKFELHVYRSELDEPFE